MQRFLSIAFLAVIALSRCEKPVLTGMTEVSGFGSNPGELKCYQYIPEGLRRNAPMVVVLHGCLQDAAEMARLSGWNSLADQEKFIVLYPQQQVSNNLNRCFNWFNESDNARNSGEALSIKQMIDHAMANHRIDEDRVFVTGISAGGAMTVAMAAAYPEVFDGAVALAGVPYGAATDIPSGMLAMGGNVTLSPEAWGDKVRRQNPGYSGPYPRMAVMHGTDDNIVKIVNAGEIVKQWINVWGIDAITSATQKNFNGNPKVQRVSWAQNGKNAIVRYDIGGIGHAIPVDPGTGPRQGGETAAFAKDVDFHSSWWAAEFFGIAR